MRVSGRAIAIAGTCILLVASRAGHAQSFPERQGQWEATASGQKDGAPMKFCLTDATWQKALASKACKPQNMKVTSSGASYSVDCSTADFQVKGDITLTFDGKEHLTTKRVLVMTRQGKPTTIEVSADWHWKAPSCDGTESNMRDAHTPQ